MLSHLAKRGERYSTMLQPRGKSVAVGTWQTKAVAEAERRAEDGGNELVMKW